MQEEDISEGDLSEGDMPEGDMPEGDMPEGDMPERDMPEVDMPEGIMPGGEMPEGDMLYIDMPEGDMQTQGEVDRQEEVAGQGEVASQGEVARQEEIPEGNMPEQTQKTKFKSFFCSLCPYSCRDEFNLKRHSKSQHSNTQIVCMHSYCSRYFPTKFDMRKHFADCFLYCPWDKCGKRFKTQNLFDVHQKAHKRFNDRLI